jgi:hypothetical protein
MRTTSRTCGQRVEEPGMERLSLPRPRVGLGVRWCGVAAWSVHGRRAGLSGAARFITRLKGGRVGPA